MLFRPGSESSEVKLMQCLLPRILWNGSRFDQDRLAGNLLQVDWQFKSRICQIVLFMDDIHLSRLFSLPLFYPSHPHRILTIAIQCRPRHHACITDEALNSFHQSTSEHVFPADHDFHWAFFQIISRLFIWIALLSPNLWICCMSFHFGSRRMDNRISSAHFTILVWWTIRFQYDRITSSMISWFWYDKHISSFELFDEQRSQWIRDLRRLLLFGCGCWICHLGFPFECRHFVDLRLFFLSIFLSTVCQSRVCLIHCWSITIRWFPFWNHSEYFLIILVFLDLLDHFEVWSYSVLGFDYGEIVKRIEVEIEPLLFSSVGVFVLVICIWSSKGILE
jgi:hypothetical protein